MFWRTAINESCFIMKERYDQISAPTAMQLLAVLVATRIGPPI